MKLIVLFISGLIWTVITGTAVGQTEIAPQEKKDNRYDFPISGKWRGRFSPGSDIYARYIADPLQPMFSVEHAWVIDDEIPMTGDRRYIFRLGGRYGFLRIYPNGNQDRGFQLDLGGAFLGVFDIDNSLDNIGWDGLYEVLISWGNGAGLSMQGGIKHDSSHVGDEYAERTGRARIEYTRGEYVLGINFSCFDNWRVYGESGYAYDMRNPVYQKKWRVQGGLEFSDDNRFLKGRFGYFAAVNLASFEESDWNLDTTILSGFVFPVKHVARNYRIGLQYRNGRSLIGELFQYREKYISIGFWADL